MSSLTKTEFDRQVIESLVQDHADIQTDNEGQLLIYTGLYEWCDGSIHNEPDPHWGDQQMKTYIVYVDGREVGMIKAGSHNAAEKKAKERYPSAQVSVAYTEV